MCTCKPRLVLVSLLIGWKSGVGTLNQSVNEVMQNQSNWLITFDTQLKTALILHDRTIIIAPGGIRICSDISLPPTLPSKLYLTCNKEKGNSNVSCHFVFKEDGNCNLNPVNWFITIYTTTTTQRAKQADIIAPDKHVIWAYVIHHRIYGWFLASAKHHVLDHSICWFSFSPNPAPPFHLWGFVPTTLSCPPHSFDMWVIGYTPDPSCSNDG